MSRNDPTYWRVSPKFWRHAQTHGWGDDARHLAFYLLTCPHRTTEGLYWLPIGYMAADLAWVAERVALTLAALEEQDFVRYDCDACIVFLPKAMKYQRPDNPNQVKAGVRMIAELPKTSLYAAFYEAAGKYAPRLAQALPKPLEQGYTDPLALALAPTLTQEQEQELLPESGDSCGGVPAVLSGCEAVPFGDFWQPYPNKQGKQEAERRWTCKTRKRMSDCDRQRAVVVACAMAYSVDHGYKDRDKCPYGSTFLNQRRYDEWYDEDGTMIVPPGWGIPDLEKRQQRDDAIRRAVEKSAEPREWDD